MCGIAGVLFTQARPPGEIQSIVAAMSRAQQQRGPDSAGMWADGNVGLGSVRLAITGSVTDGSQPLRDAMGGISVFNGEIYNAKSLETESGNDLSGLGFSDGRVLVSLLCRHGTATLSRTRGPFALARFDPGKGVLFLARDAVGKKPLYLMPFQGGWAFASTLKALHAAAGPFIRREEAMTEYLVYRSVGGNASAFRGVHQIPAGGWVELSLDGRRRDGYWWQPPEVCEEELNSGEIHALVSDSILLRASPDRPARVFLSGGLDSSIVAAVLAQMQPASQRLTALSIGYDVTGAEDETDFAAKLARHIQLPHETIRLCAKEVPALFDEAARLTEDPIQDPVTLPTVKLAKSAAQSVKVILTGDGSDEIWGGYARFDDPPSELPAYLARTMIFTPEELGIPSAPSSYLDGLLMPPESMAPLDRILRFEVSNRMRNYHLARLDKICMGVGLEPRSPFLDINVVNQGLALPASIKRPNGVPKGLLIHAFQDLLPGWLLQRTKQPFSMPIKAWLSGPLRDYAHDSLLAPSGYTRGLTDPKPLLAKLSPGMDLDLRIAHQIWSLLQLESWHFGIAKELESPT